MIKLTFMVIAYKMDEYIEGYYLEKVKETKGKVFLNN